MLYDIQQGKKIAEIATPSVKYVVWSNDGALVALLSKHSKLHFLILSETKGLGFMVACSYHDRKQELQPELAHPRDDPH